MNMIPRTLLLFLGLAPLLVKANDQVLEIEAVIRLLLKQGYHDIREIVLEEGHYHIEALDARERKVTVYLDSDSGQLLETHAIPAAASAGAAPATPAPAAGK
ncbi:PepSY domain-containing protein [Aeromonas diversa]|nr:PepSY domain-containing protein [Aeromonas diversa]